MKNVLLLVPTFADAGGTQKLVSDLAEVLSERHNVFACSFDALREPRYFCGSTEVLTLGVTRATSILGRLAGYATKAYRLNQLKKRHRIDVTISGLWPADFINALSGGPGRRVSFGLVNIVGNQQNKPLLTFRAFVGWIYRQFDKTVAINEDLKTELGQLFGLAPSKLTCIPAFVNLPDVAGGQVTGADRAQLRIAWFGRLHRMKNLPPLFAVLKRLKLRFPGLQLVVIGEGPHRHELIAAAQAEGLATSGAIDEQGADVVFLGFVDDPFDYLRRCHVFALTSRSEGFGLVVVEAMSVGLPVVASDCPTGGPHSILEGASPYSSGRTTAEETPHGILLPIPEPGIEEHIDLWENALAILLGDEAKRAEKGRNARRRAQDFSRSVLKHDWFELIEAL